MKQVITLFFLFSSILFFGQSGELDTNFGVGGFLITPDLGTGGKIAVMPDDRIVMIGGHSEFNVIRLMPDGTPDNSFGTAGVSSVNFGDEDDDAWDVAVQPDGKIVILGVIDGDPTTNNQSFGVARLNADGSLDTSFNGTGKLVFDLDNPENYPQALALQPDGKILVAGYTKPVGSCDFVVARLNNDGTFDTTFDSDGKQTINIQSDDRCTCIALQPDGKIVLGGFSYPLPSNSSWFAAVRLNADGQPDVTFSSDGKAIAKIGFGNDTVFDMALQTDGKILLAADSYIPNSQDVGVVRFTTAGELDTTFSGDGKFNTTFNNTTDYVNAIAVQPDGKILVGGSFYDASSRKMGLLRLTADGILDTSFSTDGKADYVVPGGNGVSVYDMKLQSTGQILMSGYAQNDFMLARILSGNELGVAQFDSDAAGFYPNPARNEISFKELTNATSIFNANGQKVLDIAAGSISADVSALQTGIYMFETVDASGNIGHRKLIKE